jgi:hypothetical protein
MSKGRGSEPERHFDAAPEKKRSGSSSSPRPLAYLVTKNVVLAPAHILRLILSKIQKFLHFDAAPAPPGASENKTMWLQLMYMVLHDINQILFFVTGRDQT